MKITSISITLEPNEFERKNDQVTVILSRGLDKIWFAQSMKDVLDSNSPILVDRGLYPYEVKLANDIQELIIQKFNGGQK